MCQRKEKSGIIHSMFFISARPACLYLRAIFCMLIRAVTTMVFVLPLLLSWISIPENSDYQIFRDKRGSFIPIQICQISIFVNIFFVSFYFVFFFYCFLFVLLNKYFTPPIVKKTEGEKYLQKSKFYRKIFKSAIFCGLPKF